MTTNALIDMTRQHQLPLADARATVNELAAKLESKLGVTSTWSGEQLLLTHPNAKGVLTLEAGSINLKLQLSALLAMMRPMIEAEIQRYFDKRLGS